MATFSKATFDAAAYLAFRPSYPLWLYDEVLAFHRYGPRALARPASPAIASSSGARASASSSSIGQFNSAWDLGCGPGISSLPLQAHFGRVTGLEPSKNMVASAIRLDSAALRQGQESGRNGALEGLPSPLRTLLLDTLTAPQHKLGTIAYIQGHAEDLAQHCPPGSADLIIAAQAVHWFHHAKLWPALGRAIAPGGTVAFWGYAEFSLPEYAEQTAGLVSAFLSDPATMGAEAREWVGRKDEEGGVTNVGAFFERPGRTILDRGLVDVPWPWELDADANDEATQLLITDKWDRTSATRSMYSLAGLPPSAHHPAWPSPAPSSESKTMDLVVSWDGLERYLRTASAVSNFLAAHPDDAARHGGRDVVQRFVARVRERVPRGVEEVRMRWPLSLMMLKAKSKAAEER